MYKEDLPLSYLALAGPSGIRAGWGIEINGRFEAESPPASARPPTKVDMPLKQRNQTKPNQIKYIIYIYIYKRFGIK